MGKFRRSIAVFLPALNAAANPNSQAAIRYRIEAPICLDLSAKMTSLDCSVLNGKLRLIDKRLLQACGYESLGTPIPLEPARDATARVNETASRWSTYGFECRCAANAGKKRADGDAVERLTIGGVFDCGSRAREQFLNPLIAVLVLRRAHCSGSMRSEQR